MLNNTEILRPITYTQFLLITAVIHTISRTPGSSYPWSKYGRASGATSWMAAMLDLQWTLPTMHHETSSTAGSHGWPRGQDTRQERGQETWLRKRQQSSPKARKRHHQTTSWKVSGSAQVRVGTYLVGAWRFLNATSGASSKILLRKFTWEKPFSG